MGKSPNYLPCSLVQAAERPCEGRSGILCCATLRCVRKCGRHGRTPHKCRYVQVCLIKRGNRERERERERESESESESESERERERERERDREREREREREGQRKRKRERETERQKRREAERQRSIGR